jgi:hypothetical protein
MASVGAGAGAASSSSSSSSLADDPTVAGATVREGDNVLLVFNDGEKHLAEAFPGQ